MLLFQKRFHAGLVSGAVTVTFRRWKRTHVRPGGRYRCHPIGVLEVDRVDRVRSAAVSEEDARRSGFESRDALLGYISAGPDGLLGIDEELWRIELHHGGDGDRVAQALDDHLSAEEAAALQRRLERLGAWALPTLRLIGRQPRIAASKLAARLGRERDPFKVDVRKLKRLGLTQSFEVGYELSPRGRAFLARLPRRTATGKKRTGPKRR